jgi:hypothetical protein
VARPLGPRPLPLSRLNAKYDSTATRPARFSSVALMFWESGSALRKGFGEPIDVHGGRACGA